jgi:hypothetical protein
MAVETLIAAPARPHTRHQRVFADDGSARFGDGEFAQRVPLKLAKCTGYVPCPVTPRVASVGVADGS